MAKRTKPKDGRSAKGKYHKWLEPENLILVQGWRRDGLSDEQIAHNIGISRTTVYEWINNYPDFANAYKKGTEVSVYEVENALYKSAIGYDVQEAEKVEISHPDGTVTEQKRIKQRHIPPNIGAICFILKNRRSDKWQDKRDLKLESAEFKEIPKLYAALGAAEQEVSDDVRETEPETSENI